MNRRGMSLTEVLVATTVLSVGLGSLSGLTRSSVRALTIARSLDQSLSLTASVVDSMLAFGVVGDGTRSLPKGTLTWDVPSLPGSPGWVRFEHLALDRPVELHFYTRAEW
ncbi:MAG: type IV pilus modification PilV family protein [Longimicrobiales bacterium]